MSTDRSSLHKLLFFALLSLGCSGAAQASAPQIQPSAAPSSPASPQSSPIVVAQAPLKCGPTSVNKCGPPSKPPAAATKALAATDVLALQSTSFQGKTLRAIVGRSEIGQYLAIESIERGKTEGDADRLLAQHFIDLTKDAGTVTFVALHGFQDDTLSFALSNATGGNAKNCQLVATSATPSLRCVVARGGKFKSTH